MDLLQPWVDLAVLTFFEYLIANNLSPASLQNYIAVLSHFFAIYGWPLEGLRSRKLCLMIKSVRVNSNLKPKIKGVLSVDMLKKLLINFDFVENALSIKSIVLLGFFGFFRLGSLVPSAIKSFDRTRYPLVKDIIWTKDGFRIIMKCAKNMQGSHEYKVIHIPKLFASPICPVHATKAMITHLQLKPNDPLFMVSNSTGTTVLTAPQVRRVFTSAITSMGLNPPDFGFHCLRRSGACLALELKIPLQNIKIHGHWKSNAVWNYFTDIPKSAALVASTFAKHVK